MTTTPTFTTQAEGLRMLKLIRDSGVGEPLEARLRQRPGPRSPVTAQMLLLATLLCGLHGRQHRKDLALVLAGLHEDVAREVGLSDADRDRFLRDPTPVTRQARAMEQVLSEGWTVVENEGQPDEALVHHDLRWLERSLIRASVPDEVMARVRHVAVGAAAIPKTTGIAGLERGTDGRLTCRSDADARVGYRPSSGEQKAGFFVGYEGHTLVAAPTVVASGSGRRVTLKHVPPFIVGFDLCPAGQDFGPVATRLVLNACEVCPIGDVTGGRSYTNSDSFRRALRSHGINVLRDCSARELTRPRVVAIGKRRVPALVHAGTLLPVWTPQRHLRPPEPPDALTTPEERDRWLADWYAERAHRWGWKPQRCYSDGRVQFRCPSYAAPHPQSGTRRAVTAQAADLADWQPLPHGTPAWSAAYGAGRDAVERAHAGLMGHEMPFSQDVGLAANAISLMARAVAHNLRVTNS